MLRLRVLSGDFRPRARPERAGFTLVEMIIGMALLSVLCAVVLAMVTSQTRYVSKINTDVQLLDQVRAANELIGSEVADLPRGAVRYARRDSIAYELPIAWGVICGPMNRQLVQAPPTKAVVIPDSVQAIQFEPMATALGSPTPEGFALAFNGVDFTYHPVANWSELKLTQDDLAGNACLDAIPLKGVPVPKVPKGQVPPPPPANVQITAAEEYYRSPALVRIAGIAPAERSLIFAYMKVSYFLKPNGDNGVALYRATAGGSQKLAWPFSSSAGFTYRLADNSTSFTVPSASVPLIRAVRVDLPATRAARNHSRADTLTVQPWMPLYNAR